jgi:hypothetical protein
MFLTVPQVSTKFYLGTEDGHLVYVDWKPVKDNDTGKISTPRATFWNAIQVRTAKIFTPRPQFGTPYR